MDTLSYLGGLITGEGHFGLLVRRTKNGHQVLPNFAISMADKETMDFVEASLQSLGLPLYRRERCYEHKKHQYRIDASGAKRVRRYCHALIPYLTGEKKRAAETVLEFIELRLNRPRGQGIKAPYTDDEKALVEKIRSINGRPNLIKNHL